MDWKSVFIVVLLIGCFSGIIQAQKHLYNGYQVIKAYSDNPEELSFLSDEEDFTSQNKLKILSRRPSDGWPATSTFYVHPTRVQEIKRKLEYRGIQHVTVTFDLQRDIDSELPTNLGSAADDWFTAYHPYDEILVWLEEQAAACGSSCSIINIGQSYEGRPLNVLKITGEATECQQKPTIWIDAGIHAREWLSHSTAMFLIDRLLQEYDTDPFVKSIRDTYDWYFLTTVNPDGYNWSWTNDRMWRKSRQPNSGSICIGADVNRNFDFQWMTIGASSNPCSETFAGSAPNSEPEAKAVSDFLMTLVGTWDLFITLHTYGQLFMSPWGYTKELPDNYPALDRVGRAAVQSIWDTHGKVYTFGSAANVLYESSGTSRDFARGVPQIPFVYTIELRDTSSFVLPPTEIIPTGEEIWAALKTTINSMQLEKPPTCVQLQK